MSDTQGSTPLFAVFCLSMLLLALVPYTIKQFFFPSQPDEVAAPWQKGKTSSKNGTSKFIAKWFSKEWILIYVLWIVVIVLYMYVSSIQVSQQGFDPYEILGVAENADEQAIKSAYRKLSIQYHPDKTGNDPVKTEYFKQIAKAHTTLTDSESFKNWQEFGDPDGRGNEGMGISLPEWMFPQERTSSIIVLVVLVVCGVIVPLCVISFYLMGDSSSSGQIQQDTLKIYIQYGIKENMSVIKVPDGLVMSIEFLETFAPVENNKSDWLALRKLILELQPELKDKAYFWKRNRYQFVQAHMLLLCHLHRASDRVPPALKQYSNTLLKLIFKLNDEFINMACLPSRASNGLGWMAPAIAAIEMSAYITQAVPVTCKQSINKKGTLVEGKASILQLPNLETSMEKKIPKKIKTLQGLAALTEEQRAEQVFNELGLTAEQIAETNTFMSNIPSVQISATCYVDGEEGIKENDQVTVKVTCLVTRPAHATGSISESQLTGKSIEAYHPNYKYTKTENWYILVADSYNNHLYGHTKACLLEAERKALQNPEAVQKLADGDDSVGQVVEFKLHPRLAHGTFNLSCYCMSDSYIGVECKIPLVINVEKLGDQEQRGKPIELDSDGEPPDLSDDDSDDDQDDEDGEGEYDSEETGEEVTDDEQDDDSQSAGYSKKDN